jgi:hypothetical protein
MGYTDKQPTGRPRNTFKRDFVLYVGGGFGGGGSAAATPSNRFSFWVDHNRFATKIRQLITQNTAFQIYADSGRVTRKPVWISIDQSNDKPDELIKAAVGGGLNNTLYIDPAVQVPPYNIILISLPSRPIGTIRTTRAAGSTRYTQRFRPR